MGYKYIELVLCFSVTNLQLAGSSYHRFYSYLIPFEIDIGTIDLLRSTQLVTKSPVILLKIFIWFKVTCSLAGAYI